MIKRELVPCLYLLNGQAVTGFGQKNLLGGGDPCSYASSCEARGADRLIIFDFSDSDSEHDEAIDCIRGITSALRIPVSAGGNIKRPEDVKKLLYAGCSEAVLNGSKESNIAMLEEVSKRFGREKIAVCVSDAEELLLNASLIGKYCGRVFALSGDTESFMGITELPVVLHSDAERDGDIISILGDGTISGISGDYVSSPSADLTSLRRKMKQNGIPCSAFESALTWSELKPDRAGLIPCVVQDYRNDEVLMVAWMNEESFNATMDTGLMTYYSRSRRSLWVKGETSGHYQYVRYIAADCDRDTLLARVEQIGAACHTGSRSCFFTPLCGSAEKKKSPDRVLQDVMEVVLDRKANPKEGSYTNYLFDKGIDKILKKVGEENTEIIIAAKNPNPEEIKYEIADYLYHLTVLMAERGVSWGEIADELSRR